MNVQTVVRERMIPILPCRSLDEQLAFYEALGFEVTYRQKVPNAYAAVERGPIELQFYAMTGLDPANSYSTCYVIVADVDALYAEFRAGLKGALGKVPTRGLPRIGSLKDMSYGVRQFLMTDPGGNTIRIGQPLETDAAAVSEAVGTPGRLARALEAAVLLAESKGDPPTAARVLGAAMAADREAPLRVRIKAMILRADVAQAMGDEAIAAKLLAEVAGAPMDPADRESLSDELARAEDLRAALGIGA